jgi:hypothetical protein
MAIRALARREQHAQPAGSGAGEELEPGASLRHLQPRDARVATLGMRALALPGLEIADAGAGDQRGEVAVALLVPREQGERMAVYDQLRADDGLDLLAPGLEHEANDAPEVGGVGEAERAIAERRGALHQRLGGNGAVAEGERRVGAELEESHRPPR